MRFVVSKAALVVALIGGSVVSAARPATLEAAPVPAATPKGTVQVVVTGAASAAAVRAAVTRVRGRVQLVDGADVQARVPRSAVRALEADPAVSTVEPPAVASSDAVVSQGLTRVGADVLQRRGSTGAGVRVAVLDQAFGSLALLDGLSGTELPPRERQRRQSFDVENGLSGRDFNEDASRHGELVAELLYDVAPYADYTFVNYHTATEFGRAVDWLIGTLHPDVVVHANSFLFGPFDGTGWFARQVDRAAAAGILWVNSVGNYRTRHWEGAWSDVDGDGALDIPNRGNAIPLTLAAGDRPGCDVSWDGATTDPDDAYSLGLYLDPEGRQPAIDARTNGPMLSEFATEHGIRATLAPPVLPAAGTYYLRILRHGSPAPQHLTLYCRLDLPPDVGVTTSSVPTPGDARGALSVGAYNHRDFALMPYSSEGPTDDGRPKPDLAAPSHVQTTGGPFGGTSSASPHAAGAAALLWPTVVAETGPQGAAARVADRLRSLARDVGPPGPDAQSGAGLLRLDTQPPALDPTAAAGPFLASVSLPFRLPILDEGTLDWARVGVDGTPVASRLDLGPAVVGDVNMRGLAEGAHVLGVTLADRSGNESTFDLPLTVDRTAPSLFLHLPAVVLAGRRLTAPLVVADTGTGPVAPPTIRYGDGSTGIASFRHRYLSAGYRTVVVDARDRVGNVSSVRRRLRVLELQLDRPVRIRGATAMVVVLGRANVVRVTFRVGRRTVRIARRLPAGRRRIVLGRLPKGRYRVAVSARGYRVARTIVVRRPPVRAHR